MTTLTAAWLSMSMETSLGGNRLDVTPIVVECWRPCYVRDKDGTIKRGLLWTMLSDTRMASVEMEDGQMRNFFWKYVRLADSVDVMDEYVYDAEDYA